MAINYSLIDEVRVALLREVGSEKELLVEFDRHVNVPNYRAAFEVLTKIERKCRIPAYLKQLCSRFWHEVAE